MVVRRKKKLIRSLALALGGLILLILAWAPATPRSVSPYHRLTLFAKVLSHIERFYVEPVGQDEIVFGAIRGMIRTLDPHSAFLTPEELQILRSDTEGQFGGVGLEVGVRDDILTVIAPMPRSPAKRADIRSGDQIVAIEGRPTHSMSIDEAVRLMRGKPGTPVSVTIHRPKHGEPFDVRLTREIIQVESVKATLLASGFAHLEVRLFQDGTTDEVKKALAGLTQQGGPLRGIVLDLRRNPGGVFNEAVGLTDLFIAEGVIVSTRGKNGQILQQFEARPGGTMGDVPLVALVDQASASAAEIVAGALQDHGRALLVGTRSFGKGSVQSIIDLNDGYGLKLTVSRYFTPKGRSIQAQGVVPDVQIESRDEPQPDEESLILAATASEHKLPGHLAPKEGRSASGDDPQIDDYQLRIAFQLVRGLSRAKTAGDPADK